MKKQRKAPAVMFAVTALILAAIICLFAFNKPKDDIYIYFTGDVHCADDEHLGYAGVKALADYTRNHISEYVTLVDTGDAIWGDFPGNNSKGEYIIELMNDVGYDYAVPGNHEFDYGVEQLSRLMEMADASYLSCNISYTGSGENPLDALKPYAIETYGDTKVAFIGVTTPTSITSSSPAVFMENGEIVYEFGQTDSEAFYSMVQTQIDASRNAGADYVILLTHLGDGEEYGAYSSEALIGATNGVDAVLDGHAHNEIPCRMTPDKDGTAVPLSSTGTELENIGQLILTPSGNLSLTLISGTIAQDEAIASEIDAENEKYDAAMSETVGYTDFALPTHDADGERMVRNRETALGNFCADAYRASTGADIAFVNGGGLRAPIEAGDITFGDIMAVNPYGNNLCVAYATGREIADALEFAVRNSSLDENGSPYGEDGGFLDVSGLRFTVDTSIPSSVAVDENGMFLSVEGERRAGDIMVVTDDGEEPLDPDRTYTVAAFDYILQECGDGYSMFADNEYAIRLGKFDYEALAEYLKSFDGSRIPSEYSAPQGRITIK